MLISCFLCFPFFPVLHSYCTQLSDSGMVELSKLPRLECFKGRGLSLMTTVGASVLLRDLRTLQKCDLSECHGRFVLILSFMIG